MFYLTAKGRHQEHLKAVHLRSRGGAFEGWLFFISQRQLTLQPGQSNAAHEVLLEYQEDDQRRYRDQDRAGHDGLVVGAAEAAGHAGDDEREGQLLFLVEDDEGPEVGVEGAEEDEDGQGGEDGLGQGQDDVAVNAKIAAAVDLGGVV